MQSTIERSGTAILRYGLALVLVWIGAMKFTTYEAAAIRPLVENSPLLSWLYPLIGERGLANLLGVFEVMTGLLIAAKTLVPRLSTAAALAAVGMFATTLTFLFSTPGFEASLGGFPALSVVPGQFLLKDIVLLGASLWCAGDALAALHRQAHTAMHRRPSLDAV